MDDELKDQLMEEIFQRNKTKIKCYKSFSTVWLRDDYMETEFRYVILLNKIIVSRICFKNRRQGCMTRCFEILKAFADRLNYDTIEIQSVETYEMSEWCRKNKFVPAEYAISIRDNFGHEFMTGDYDYKLQKN